MLKHYAEFLYPGLLVADTSAAEVTSRDPDTITLPDGCFGFRFHDREEVTLENGKTLCGAAENFSGWYYIGERFDLEQVKREKPHEHTLIENMRYNGYAAVVMTRYGQAFPLRDGDVVLSK